MLEGMPARHHAHDVKVMARGAGQRVLSVVFEVVTGCFADWFGRMLVLFVAVVILLASTGSAVATYIVTGTVFFEVTTHENRPIHIVITGPVALVFSDSWLVIMREAKLPWQAEQAFFLTPTFLLLPAFFSVLESPRWLIATARCDKAEHVMLAAAKLNKFPLQNTACLMQELRLQKDQVADNTVHQTEQMLRCVSIPKHAFAPSALSFCLVNALRTGISLTVMREIPAVRWTAPSATALCFPHACEHADIYHDLLHSPRRSDVRTKLANLPAFSDLLLVTDKALSAPTNIVLTVHTLELFPTPVRGTAAGWIFGCGASGDLCATVALTLLRRKRTDVFLATAGFFLFASTLAQRSLPENTTVECTKMQKSRKSIAIRKMHHMKSTLIPIGSVTRSTSNCPQTGGKPPSGKKLAP
ncbi:hypothetical protein HPB48_018586 [Haemaphysalis longicornis]|uniref:Uncharacterized protein n=1 Tax=Haemaphysalis longicornis TaxID=44386 RepID=A0A9J6G9W7_HAELO|nr:hypothetical protein HPB48_018586 [Haemaphysalis longicornis]